MKVIEAVGKTVEKAIAEGLKELGLTQDEVDIKILDEGGFFRKARVQLSYDDGGAKKPVYDIADDPIIENRYNKKQEKAEIKIIKKEVKSAKEEHKQVKDAVNKEPIQDKIKSASNLSGLPVDPGLEKIGKDFLKGLLKKLDIAAEINVSMAEQGVNFSISGEKINELIGYRGETLNAVQYILSIIIKNAGFKDIRTFLDVENYKVRREESLIALGSRLAAKAIKINKPVRLEPMNAFERRIIHTALQDNTDVYTKSEGEEPRRHLVIIPKRK